MTWSAATASITSWSVAANDSATWSAGMTTWNSDVTFDGNVFVGTGGTSVGNDTLYVTGEAGIYMTRTEDTTAATHHYLFGRGSVPTSNVTAFGTYGDGAGGISSVYLRVGGVDILNVTNASLITLDNFAIRDAADSNRARFTFSTSNSYDARSAGRHLFNIAGTEYMRLTENSLLVGTTSDSADYKFFVQKSNTATSGISYAGRFNNGNAASSAHTGDMYGVYGLAYQQSGSDTITDIWGVNAEARVESGGGGVTGSAAGVRAVVNNQASSTIAVASGVRVSPATNTGGGTITTAIGVDVDAQSDGTNRYGIRLQNASAANVWNIYASGTAANYLEGNVLIGSGTATSGNETLQVDGSLSINSATMIRTYSAFTNGAAASTGTLTNAPAAGNPTKWIPINDNGTTRYIPAW